MRLLSARNKNSYIWRDKAVDKTASGPLFFSANLEVLLILLTILLIKL